MDRYPRARSDDRDYYQRNDRSNHEQAMRRYPERHKEYEDFKEPDSKLEHVEGTLYFSDCMLVPPRDGIDKPLPAIKPKPPGCKTIFVGGIPEPLRGSMKRVEAIMAEIFTTNGGKIDTIRLNDRGFCHIRFVKEDSVDMAMSVAGYCMVVKQSGDSVRFRLIVDYSQSRGDAEEYEARRILAEKLQLSNVPSISAIPPCNSYMIDEMMTDLKEKSKFEECVIIIRSWLESGFMDRQNAHRFFTMCQLSFTSQVRRLLAEKVDLDAEFKEVKARYNQNLSQLDAQFQHVISLYEDTRKQRCWDILSKPQRKSIETWLSQTKEGLSSAKKIVKPEKTQEAKEVGNSSAQTMRPGSRSNGAAAKAQTHSHINSDESDVKDQKILSLEESVQQMRKQIWEMEGKLSAKEAEIRESQDHVTRLRGQVERVEAEAASKAKKRRYENEASSSQLVEGTESKALCALATFLQIHPNGATLKSIEAYLNEVNLLARVGDVDAFLRRFPQVFSKQPTDRHGQARPCWKTTFLNTATPQSK